MPSPTLPPSWKRLADEHGGAARLAEVLGVSVSTLYRWSHGVSPVSGPGARLLDLLTGGHPPTVDGK